MTALPTQFVHEFLRFVLIDVKGYIDYDNRDRDGDRDRDRWWWLLEKFKLLENSKFNYLILIKLWKSVGWMLRAWMIWRAWKRKIKNQRRSGLTGHKPSDDEISFSLQTPNF